MTVAANEVAVHDPAKGMAPAQPIRYEINEILNILKKNNLNLKKF